MADIDTTQLSSGPYMLTTIDNPFDPFTQWDEWFNYDESSGYHTCALLARVTILSDSLSPSDEELAVQQAIDEVATLNVSGIHRKVSNQS